MDIPSYLLGKKAGGGSSSEHIQYDVMPTANATTVGKIVQYTGTTTQDYTNGYFYIGTTDGEAVPTYSWENIEVQAGGGGEEKFVLIMNNISSSSNVEIANAWLQASDLANYKFASIAVTDTTYKYTFYPLNIRLWKIGGVDYIFITFWRMPNGIDGSYLDGSYIYYVKFTLNNNVITNTTGGQNATFFNRLLTTNSEQWINAKKQFSVLPESSITPTTANQLTNKSYVDSAISSAVGSINTVLATLTTPSSNGGE